MELYLLVFMIATTIIPAFLPFAFSFIYGLKTKKTGVERTVFWMLYNLIVSTPINLIAQYVNRSWCGFGTGGGEGTNCSFNPSLFLIYLIITLILGFPLMYLGAYIKSRRS